MVAPRACATRPHWPLKRCWMVKRKPSPGKAIEKAKDGDMAAIRLCLDRACPPVKDRPVTLEMPQVESAQDAARAAGAVLQAVADGELTPSEAAEVSKIVRTYVAALEASELEQRITKLEEAK
jgi:hypothetical protein